MTVYAASAADALVFVTIFNMLTSCSMSQIWGMINSLQITSHLPIISIVLPTYTNPIIKEVLEIASFELLPLGEFVYETLELVKIPKNDG